MSRFPDSLLLLPLAALLVLPACDPDDDDDSAIEDGNVLVPGVGAFETIQEALDAAPDCASITVGPGEYDERLRINKCVTLVGAGNDRTVVLGGGAGTILDIDQVAAPVLVSGMALFGPASANGTIRGARITDSTDVTLDDLFIGFEVDPNTGTDHGNVGIDVSRSTVLVAGTTVSRVGFGSEVGGTCLLSQTGSDVTVDGSTFEGGGSFGIHAVGGSLYVKDTSILQTNRSPGAQQFEPDGSGIYAEDFSQAVTLDNVTIENGAFVAAWMDVPTVVVNGGSFGSFAYGVYLPGDTGSAAGRRLTVTGATFTDLAQQAVLSIASTTVTGSTFQTSELVTPAPMGGTPFGAVRVVAPGGTVDISGNIISGNGGPDGIRVLGNSADGNVASVNIRGNTVQDMVGGNGIQVVQADEATIEDNIISGIDHTYNIDAANPGNNGLIVNGFGLACFQVDGCNTARNVIEGSEFANLVIVNSFFTSVDDQINGGIWRAAQVEQSQGTFSGLTVENQLGVGITLIDSTVVMDGTEIRGMLRGPDFRDYDENEDPPEEEILRWSGGDALESFSNGSASYLEVTGSLFEDNVDSALVTRDGQLVFTGNTLINNGYEYDDGSGIIFGPGSAIQVLRGDEGAFSGPVISDNVIDGNLGSWAISVTGAPGVQVEDNVVCGGLSAGLYFSGNDGGLIRGNWFGGSPNGEAASCDSLNWTYQLYLANNDLNAISQGVEVSENQLVNATAQYGLFISALGPMLLADNVITGGASAGLRALISLPASMTSDADGDGIREYQGDCDDLDPTTWWSRDTQSGAPEILGDGVDNDCDGVADDGLDDTDADGDGVSILAGDCDDTDPTVYPGATETVGDEVDQDCALFANPNSSDRLTRWADFDAPLPVPNLTLEGNAFSDLGAGLDIDGAIVVLDDGPADDNPNSFTNLSAEGFVIDDWIWSSSTPESEPGSLTIGPGTIFDTIGGDCIRVQGEGSQVWASEVTFADCGGSGVSMYSNGEVSLTDVDIVNPVGNGAEIGSGVLTLFDVTIDGATTGIVSQGGAVVGTDVEILNSTDDALRVVSSGLSVGSVSLSGGTLAGALGDGAEVQSGSLTLDGTSIASAGLSGINATGGVVTASNGMTTACAIGASIGGAADVTFEDWTIDGMTGVGIAQSSGMLTLDGGSVLNSGANGLDLTGPAMVEVLGSTVTDSAGYGMSCGPSVTSSSCTATMANNALGDLNGCGFCTLQ